MTQDSPLNPDGNLTEAEYEQFAHAQAPDGLIGHPNDTPPVAISGGTLVMRANLPGLLRGFPWSSGPDPVVFSPSLSGATRTDLLVLQLDRPGGYVVRAVLRTGTAGNPAPSPVVGTGPADKYEIAIGEAQIGSGAIQKWTPRAWFIGPDGQILCTADTRPPVSPYRAAYEVDTGRVIVSDGATWSTYLDDSGPLSVSMLTGWTASVRHVRRRGGVAVMALTGLSRSTSIPADTDVKAGTLPAGCAPAVEMRGLLLHDSAAGLSVGLRVTTGGEVRVITPQGVGINAGRTLTGSLSWLV